MLSLIKLPEAQHLRSLTADGRLLFSTRMVRMFAYGFLSVILALYLSEVGLSEGEIGLVLTLTLVGDTVITLWITTHADRMGRRRMLLVGAGLMALAGIVFALTSNLIWLTAAAIIGTISPSGNEVGPFLSIEQAALTQTISDDRRTGVFAWYNLFGSFSTASGALIGGGLSQLLRDSGSTDLTSYRVILIGYGLLGLLLGVFFTRLSAVVEAPNPTPSPNTDPTPNPSPYTDPTPNPSPYTGRGVTRRFLGLERSHGVVMKLSALFALDAFAGGLIVQSLIAYWFHVRFGVDTAALGAIFFGANLFAGLSALAAARLAARIGLINTMVYTHLPSNIMLMFVPLMPNLPLAIGLLLARFSISQMDVPTRQSYVMAVVDPAERSAAAGVTAIARTIGSSVSPLLTGIFLNASLLSLPFLLAGGLKIVYDLALYRSFQALKPPEEQKNEVDHARYEKK